MKIIDPVPFFGVDSGLRTLVVTRQERATLLRAAAILDRGHELVVEAIGDEHYDYDLMDALCVGPESMRLLATEGLSL